MSDTERGDLTERGTGTTRRRVLAAGAAATGLVGLGGLAYAQDDGGNGSSTNGSSANESEGNESTASGTTEGTADDGGAVPTGEQFYAELSSEKVVPQPTDTGATGLATFETAEDDQGSYLHYEVTLRTVEKVSGTHVHVGGPDETGPHAAHMFDIEDRSDEERSATGDEPLVLTGAIRPADLEEDYAGEPLSALVRAMEEGGLYVNVHTDQYSDGELRGQIESGQAPTGDGKAKDGENQAGDGKAKDGGSQAGDGKAKDDGTSNGGNGKTKQ